MPLPSTYIPIATNTLSSATATVTFSNIPNTYTDLVIVMQAGATSLSDAKINFNSDTGTNYSNTYLWGSVSPTTGSARASNQTFMYACYYANFDNTIQNTHIINIMNYANTTTNKSVLIRGNKAGTSTDAIAGLWRSTAAINAIALGSVGSTFISGSTFTLYGIKAA